MSVELGMTKYVRWLDLSHNDLKSLPDEFCAFGYALDELHIRHNRLQGLPQSIASLQVIISRIEQIQSSH